MSDSKTAILNLASKNAELLHNNIGRLTNLKRFIHAAVLTAWATLIIKNINPDRTVFMMFTIVIVGAVSCELIKIVEQLTIEKLIKLEKAISMAYIGQIKSLRNFGFSTNIEKITLKSSLRVLSNNNFNLTRFFYIILFFLTFIWSLSGIS